MTMLSPRKSAMGRFMTVRGSRITYMSLLMLFMNVLSANSGEFGPWDGGLSPARSDTLLKRRSRARIIQDDAAFFDDLHVDPLQDKAENVMEEARDFPDSVVITDTANAYTDASRLQLALSEEPCSIPPTRPSSNIATPIDKTKLRSTGTTIVGCLVEEGRYVILGADTRATDDRMVADKTCEKIHRLASNVFCCGAGTSADLDALTRLAHYSMALQALQDSSIGNTRESESLETHGGILVQPVQVSAACRFLRDALYDAGGSLGVNLIVGGHDILGNSGVLTAIHPHGSMDVVPYAALGSGGLAAMAVVESRYHPGLSRQEGIDLVKDAVTAGIENDLGSGSQVDLCVLGPGGFVEYTRAVVPEQQLESSDDTKETMDEAMKKEGTGVNGFGNLPYAVMSRRVVASAHDESVRLEKWKALLDRK